VLHKHKYYLSINLNILQNYIDIATLLVFHMYRIYIVICVHIHVAAVVCRDPPLSTKKKARQSPQRKPKKTKLILYTKIDVSTCTKILGFIAIH